MSNQHELEQTTTVPIRLRFAAALLSLATSPHRDTQHSLHQWSPPHPVRRSPLVLVSTRPADHYLYEPQMNDMLSGGPAPSGCNALEQMGETHHPVEASDGDDKAVTVTRSAMATDRAAEGEAGDAKV